MPRGNPNWAPGVSGNPAGRKPGSYTKRNEEMFQRLAKRGDRDPADILSEIASDEAERKELRIQAAAALLPYRYAKHGLLPAPPPLVYVEHPVELPHPHATEIRQVIENLEYLSALRRDGKLDLAAADALISDMRLVRDALEMEAKLLLAQGGPRDSTIRIVGGLPPLPLGPGDQPLIMPDHSGANVLDGYEPLGPPAPPLPPTRPKGEG